MSESHTPGPWRLLMQNDEHAAVYEAADADNLVAEAWGEADARLIAAAPTMYEACRLALEALESLQRDGVTGSEDDDAAHALAQAIARATGSEVSE